MVEWTESEVKTLERIWRNVDVDVIGPLALTRCLIVYPWTQRYFGSFGDLSTEKSIQTNPKVANHGVVVLSSMKSAMESLTDMKNKFSALSTLHSEKLHVDPDNFRLLSDCLTITVAGRMGSKFTAEMHATWQKFLSVLVSALGRQYH
ncbi:hypothetical protein NHX12_000669 [Muraenolepis orangiensis]|uniref:Globin domain-containing protein n=1 Tax=Muraenolepis orangiensis TaxID=630683 RepID=A0A9Q0E3P3_9TELE|nr:hypothetical protein NHX12_000669 [Muraenolepis orangiensis]